MQTPTVLPLEEQAYLSTLLTQPYRYYHNISHVNDCLAELYKMLNNNIANNYGWELTYAIWYHDIVYNPYSLSVANEEQSAELFTEYQVKHGKSSRVINDEIAYAIRATAFHTATQSMSDAVCEQEIDIAKYMLDIDLAGLGKDPSIFARNSWNIRLEYYNTSNRALMEGRLKFFTELNKRPSFYYTEYFKDLYHQTAKYNVAHEISMLEKAIESNDADVYFNDVFDHMKGLP